MLVDRLAHELGDVDVGVGGDLAGDDDQAGGDQRLAGHAAVRVLGEDGVEDGVGDLVGHLVGVALGDRLGGEGVRGHVAAPCCWAGWRTDAMPASSDGPGYARFDVSGDVVSSLPSAPRIDHLVGVVLEADARGADTSLATMRSRPLRAQLAAALARQSSVSAANPTRIWPGRLRAPEVGQEVGGRLEHDLGNAVVLLELRSAARIGPEVGHGGGHDHDVGAGGPRHAPRPPSRRRSRPGRRRRPAGGRAGRRW